MIAAKSFGAAGREGAETGTISWWNDRAADYGCLDHWELGMWSLSLRKKAARVAVWGILLLVIAAIFWPKFMVRPREVPRGILLGDYVQSCVNALNEFHRDTGRYPTTEEGLESLVTQPVSAIPGWKGPYANKVPVDPWDQEFVYRSAGRSSETFELFQASPNGSGWNGEEHRLR
jgi:general secretion pathway protein G